MPPAPGLSGNTLRQFVHTILPGKQLRLHVSNLFGDGPMTLSSVSLSLGDRSKPVLFKGKPDITMIAGTTAISDAFDFDLPAFSDLAITIRFGDVPAKLTGHPGSRSTSLLWADSPDNAVKTVHWYVITGLDVIAPESSAEVVVLGDSITDGRGSTTDGNDRWTDNLARRLPAGLSVLNEGLGGNAIVQGGLGPPASTRFQRDILGQNAPKWAIVMEGVNDIGASRSDDVAAKLIDAMKTFIAEAHAKGLKIYAIPILPFGGSMYDSPAHREARAVVNFWISRSGAFDAVIDSDAVLRDPAAPDRLRAEYDTGDHLHPNAVGYHELADAIDLSLFQ